VVAECRPGTAAAAGLVVGLAIALALRGVARVQLAEAPDGPAPALLGARVRAWYRGVLRPWEDELVAAQVHPDLLTFAQLAVSALAGASFASGWIFVAGWLSLLAGTLDILDGGVARRLNVASARGALIDSVVDRWAEFTTFLGLGAFFRAQAWMVLIVALAAFGSLMVSYTRARAEGLGLALDLGRAQRPERVVLLGFGAWLSGLVAHLACPLLGRPTHVVLEVTVVVLAAVALWTALERARHAARALGGQVLR
jgi:CDP-diacylglycerol--glycerol-3-phosphate 3-phosphatidyltransferase